MKNINPLRKNLKVSRRTHKSLKTHMHQWERTSHNEAIRILLKFWKEAYDGRYEHPK